MKPIRAIHRLGSHALRVMGAVGCVALFVMMGIAFVDVISRNLIGRPLPAASEIIEITMVLTIFLLYPAISYKGMHINIDLLDRFMPDLAKRIQHLVVALLGISVFCAIAYRINSLAADAWSWGEVTGVLGIPLGLVYSFISVMSVVTALSFAATIPAAFVRGRFEHPSISIEDTPE